MMCAAHMTIRVTLSRRDSSFLGVSSALVITETAAEYQSKNSALCSGLFIGLKSALTD